MVDGPQGIFAKVPGLGASFMALTRVFPLKRGRIEKRGASLCIDRSPDRQGEMEKRRGGARD
jgi:hypothetical protein